MNWLNLAKHLPTILSVLDIVGKLFKAIEKRFATKAANEPIDKENDEVKKQKDRLVELGQKFLPVEVQMFASEREIKIFADSLLVLADAIIGVIHTFIPLTQPNIGPEPKA